MKTIRRLEFPLRPFTIGIVVKVSPTARLSSIAGHRRQSRSLFRDMKIALIYCLLAILACLDLSAAEEGDLGEPGGHSHMFEYTLEFQPGSDGMEAHFEATLTNVTKNDLSVVVNDKSFHSTLEITDDSGKMIKAFTRGYRALLLTSVWATPTIIIESKKSIRWTVPLSSLLTLHGDEVNHDLLAGRQVVSKMNMAVVLEEGSSDFNDAKQRSKPITIPARK